MTTKPDGGRLGSSKQISAIGHLILLFDNVMNVIEIAKVTKLNLLWTKIILVSDEPRIMFEVEIG